MKKLLCYLSKARLYAKKQPIKALLAIFLGSTVLLLAFVSFTYFYYIDEISDPSKLVTYKNSGMTFYDNRGDFLYATDGTRNIGLIDQKQIPEDLKQAAVAIEDQNFYSHPGISFRGILRSFINNIRDLDPFGSGGSTITQQLVKNSLLTQKKTIIRKMQEIILSPVVERKYSKDEILTFYLSTVYYGEGSFGAREAAKTYFNKELRDLTLAESSLLAGLTRAPSVFSPLQNPDLAKERQGLVLSEMKSLGYINQSEYNEAVDLELNFAKKDAALENPHFVLWLKSELEKNHDAKMLKEEGLKIYTTLDPVLQKRAEMIVKSHVEQLRPYGANNAGLLSIENNSGNVLAMVGSADWFDNEADGKFNTVFANRQPGSSFKPIVYLAAFQDGYTPATLLHDKPTEFEKGYKPTNFDNKFRGNVLARRALASSINVPTVELGMKVGLDKVLETARNLGVTTLRRNAKFYGPNLSLGGGEVKLFEMTNVFATFARGGKLVPITGIRKIEDKNSSLIFENSVSSKTVVDPRYAFLITDILSDDEARSEVFGREGILKLSRPAAVKTGTTDDFKDSWTIGYSLTITTGVWVGNNESKAMDYVAGAIGAAPIWREFMEFALMLRPPEKFKKPNGVESAIICKNNGLLAKKGAKNTYLEYFVEGTVPTKSSNCK